MYVLAINLISSVTGAGAVSATTVTVSAVAVIAVTTVIAAITTVTVIAAITTVAVVATVIAVTVITLVDPTSHGLGTIFLLGCVIRKSIFQTGPICKGIAVFDSGHVTEHIFATVIRGDEAETSRVPATSFPLHPFPDIVVTLSVVASAATTAAAAAATGSCTSSTAAATATAAAAATRTLC